MPKTFSLLLLALIAPLVAHAQYFADGGDSITTRLLVLSSQRAEKMVGPSAVPSSMSYAYTVDYKGKSFKLQTLTMQGYRQYFKLTNGPILRDIAGINFGFTQRPDSAVFVLYNAFLAFMMGMYWFSILKTTSAGKSSFDIVSFAGKLMMGLLVSYNVPTVYAMAMTLKDMGQMLVVTSMNSSTVANANLSAASPTDIETTSIRDQAMIEAIQESAPFLYTLNPEGSDHVSKGLDQLITQVSFLNQYITTFQSSVYCTSSNIPSSSSASSLAFTSTITPTSTSLLTPITTPLSGTMPNLDLVGFNGPSDKTLTNPFFNPTEAQALLPASAAKKTGSVTRADMLTPVTFKTAGSSTVSYAGGSPTTVVLPPTTGFISPNDVMLANLAPNVASASWLANLFNGRLTDFIRVSSRTTSPSTPIYAQTLLSISRGPIYMGNGTAPTIANRVTTADLDGTTTVNTLYLGDMLYAADAAYAGSKKDDDAQKAYKDKVKAITQRYLNYNFATPTPDSVKPGSASSSWFSNPLAALLSLVANIPKMVANLFLWITKQFWVPMVAKIADLYFNFLIEIYCYVLWLAYPFWFYKKTEKAFTGALNTLISNAFTAATFCLLILMFEGFAGNIMDSILGGPAAGGVMLASMAGVGPGAVTLLVGVGIGYSIFYMVGTAICLRLAPKIFKAFLDGTSVATPLIMGAVTAVAAGAVGGVLGGAVFAGAASTMGAGAHGIGKTALTGLKSGAKGLKQMASSGLKTGKAIAKSAFTPGGNQDAANAEIAAHWGATKAGGSMMKTAAGKAAGRVADDVGGVFKNSGKAISGAYDSLKADPKGFLGKMAGSKMAQMGVLAAASMTGDIGAPLKAMGTMIYGQRLLDAQAQRAPTSAKGGTAPQSSEGMAGGSGSSSNPSSSGGSNPAAPADKTTHSNQKVRHVVKQEVETDIEVLESSSSTSDAKLAAMTRNNISPTTSPQDAAATIKQKTRVSLEHEIEMQNSQNSKDFANANLVRSAELKSELSDFNKKFPESKA